MGTEAPRGSGLGYVTPMLSREASLLLLPSSVDTFELRGQPQVIRSRRPEGLPFGEGKKRKTGDVMVRVSGFAREPPF